MLFVPKGCVLLTAAVDRLAEARRTAAQANDDGKHAAREELRGEFYSGSMLATVLHPGSGKTYTIFPERWALKKALTWLEQGECLLTKGLVYPRFGIAFNKDPTVSIFVSEHDLQRLMAKQEVKQESVPPPDPSSRRKPISEADAIKEFDNWRRDRGDNIPTEAEDIAHMKLHGVSRGRVRELRQRPGVKILPTGKHRPP
jgi:hypothetical protein